MSSSYGFFHGFLLFLAKNGWYKDFDKVAFSELHALNGTYCAIRFSGG